ncbi:unnamed protein product [Tilletia laevis]|uniref:MICOS complex subunit MIC19 n=2 Tax=Tilletia TaxID=13289 RepID=A0A9N8QRR5_9BASI|nr:hypothetical protein CF336_g4682 [Tilletia laevis]CAD6885597.1 unnamed protein product [Tilletia caries]KAE8200843.1 hypothetical protein CF335_g3865 [Tilletia laevis]CAD6939532.1 unnamed protein product [Tilletia caries]CAD6940270.1 unnamed protein product [Tilletia laevis]
MAGSTSFSSAGEKLANAAVDAKNDVVSKTDDVVKQVQDRAEKVKQQTKDAFSSSSDKVTEATKSAGAASSSSSSSSSSPSEKKATDTRDSPPSGSWVPTFLTGARQSKLDAQIQSKIKTEISALRKKESDVRAAIDAALQAENEKESSGGTEKAGKSGVELRKELEELRGRLGKVAEKSTREIEGETEIRKAREEVVACYKAHPDRTLDCWEQAQAFKQAVAKAEQAFVRAQSTASKA